MDGDRSSLSLPRSCFHSCSHRWHATCLVNIERNTPGRSWEPIYIYSWLPLLSLILSLTLDSTSQISIIVATTLCSASKPTTLCRSWLLVPFLALSSIIRMYHFGLYPQIDCEIWGLPSPAVVLLLFLIINYCFRAHILLSRHIHPVLLASSLHLINHSHAPIHLVISVPNRFSTIIFIIFRRE